MSYSATALRTRMSLAALVAMLERMAAFHTDLEGYGVTRAEVVAGR